MARAFRIDLSEFDKLRKRTSFCSSLASGNVLRELRIKLGLKPVFDGTDATKSSELTLHPTKR